MDTLFDLDTIAPSSAPMAAAPQGGLASAIAARETLPMRAASDALAAWAAGKRLHGADPVLLGDFVDEWSLARWRVANVAQREDGDVVLRLVSVDGGDADRLSVAARLSADGSLVDVTASRWLPASLIPKCDAEPGLVAISATMTPTQIVGRSGPWVRLRPVDAANDGDYVRLESHILVVPERLLPEPAAPVPESTLSAALALHHQQLRSRVLVISQAVLSLDTVREAAALLAEYRHPSSWRFSAPAPHDFSAEEVQILSPVLSLFRWTFENDCWRASVACDVTSGWTASFEVSGQHLPSGAELEATVSLPMSDRDLLNWFNTATRQDRAMNALTAELCRRNTPVDENAPSAPRSPRRTARPKAAPKEDRESFGRLLETLRPLAASNKLSNALVAAADVAATSTTTSAEIAAAGVQLAEAFSSVGAGVQQHADSLLARSHWNASVIAEAQGVLREAELLRGITHLYSDGLRDLADLLAAVGNAIVVREVAPGYWASVDVERSLHGCVSSSGFFSGACGGRDENMANKDLVTHLLEDEHTPSNFRHLLKSKDCPAELAEWIHTLPTKPELNAARCVGRLIQGVKQTRSIRTSAVEAIRHLNAFAARCSSTTALYEALEWSCVKDEVDVQIASMLRRLFECKYGPFEAKTTVRDDDLFCEAGFQGDPDEDDEAIEVESEDLIDAQV